MPSNTVRRLPRKPGRALQNSRSNAVVRGGQRQPPSRRDLIAMAAGVVAIVGGGGIIGIVKMIFDDDPSGLSLSLASVFSPKEVYGDGDAIPSLLPGGIDLTVRNLGRQPAVIKEAQVVYLDSARLTACMYGSFIAPEKCYKITLPIDPTPGQTDSVSLCHKVPSNEVARIKIAFSFPKDRKDTLGEVGMDVFAYKVGLTLLCDDGTALNCGSYVLVAPRDTLVNHFQPERDRRDGISGWLGPGANKEAVDEVEACFELNESNLLRVAGNVSDNPRGGESYASSNIRRILKYVGDSEITEQQWMNDNDKARKEESSRAEGDDLCSRDTDCQR